MHKKYYYLVMCVESQLEGNLCFQKLEILKIWFLKQVEIIPSITDPQFPSAMQLEALKALLEATAADITPPRISTASIFLRGLISLGAGSFRGCAARHPLALVITWAISIPVEELYPTLMPNEKDMVLCCVWYFVWH